MSTSRRLSAVFAFGLFATAAAAAEEERLVLFGGGPRPAAAMTRFVQWAGGSAARILVVPWASSGDKVEVRPGLGLLPGVIVDQHFLKRQRQNRLFGLVLKHPEERGVGIDEGAALLVHGHEAEVVGGSVMVVDARTEPGTLLVAVVPAGGRFDLARRP